VVLRAGPSDVTRQRHQPYTARSKDSIRTRSRPKDSIRTARDSIQSNPVPIPCFPLVHLVRPSNTFKIHPTDSTFPSEAKHAWCTIPYLSTLEGPSSIFRLVLGSPFPFRRPQCTNHLFCTPLRNSQTEFRSRRQNRILSRSSSQESAGKDLQKKSVLGSLNPKSESMFEVLLL